MTNHKRMWDGRLGEINATEHRIELKEEARPVYQLPYRSGFKEREFSGEQSTNPRLCRRRNIQLGSSLPVIVSPKKDYSMKFCVDFRQLNAVTKRY